MLGNSFDSSWCLVESIEMPSYTRSPGPWQGVCGILVGVLAIELVVLRVLLEILLLVWLVSNSHTLKLAELSAP